MRKPEDEDIIKFRVTKPRNISPHLKLRYLLEIDQRWHLYIGVDEMTTAQELRDAWPEIDQEREKLKRWQGSDLNRLPVALLVDLESQKQESSYQALAMDMNFDALVFLLWAIDIERNGGTINTGHFSFVNLLQAFGVKNENVEMWEREGKTKIVENKIPWGVKDGPIVRRRIIDALRQFKRKIDNNSIVVIPENDRKLLMTIRIIALGDGYWTQAIELIQRFKPEEYKDYEMRYNARKDKLIRKRDERNREFFELIDKSLFKGVEFPGVKFQ